MKFFFFFFFFFFNLQFLFSQTIPVAENGTEEQLRVLQLIGKLDVNQSLTARPFFCNKSFKRYDLLSLVDSNHSIFFLNKSYWNNKIRIAAMPATFVLKYNSHHPYGWNDAGMIMAKGTQTMLSAGIYANFGSILTIQLQPEYYYAANQQFDTTGYYGSYTSTLFHKTYLGQSSIRLNFGGFSVGASTENLWWGPGQFSSLVMSNNAPGFFHFTFNTTQPVKTSIGSFEGQLIGAKLDEDTAAQFENTYLKHLNPKNDWRYFNGLVITYQPKWLSNFFFGFIASQHLYHSDQMKESGFIHKYLPIFSAASPTANADTSSIATDGYLSFFSRWLLLKYQMEFYIEYGYNDYKQNFRDFAVNTNHSAAYIIGFKKEINLKQNQLLDINFEMTQMAQTTSYVVRTAGNWYEHGLIPQGLSYQNQNLGAGSGQGNNVQTFQIKKMKGFDYWGIKLQHVQEDPKGRYGSLNLIGMRDLQWNDWAIGGVGQKRINQLLINGELQFVESTNYGWTQGNKFNLFAQIKCSYFF